MTPNTAAVSIKTSSIIGEQATNKRRTWSFFLLVILQWISLFEFIWLLWLHIFRIGACNRYIKWSVLFSFDGIKTIEPMHQGHCHLKSGKWDIIQNSTGKRDASVRNQLHLHMIYLRWIRSKSIWWCTNSISQENIPLKWTVGNLSCSCRSMSKTLHISVLFFHSTL